MLDFSIFVDVDLETQLDRRIYRDQESRGYDESDIIYQWNNHVTPCFKNYIEPFKEQSSFIYRNDKNEEICRGIAILFFTPSRKFAIFIQSYMQKIE